MANPEWTEPWEWEDCAKCGKSPVREILDDTPLCQECCDAWARAKGEHGQQQTMDRWICRMERDSDRT